jgi:quinohemoprotein ethanol dehydrogenase
MSQDFTEFSNRSAAVLVSGSGASAALANAPDVATAPAWTLYTNRQRWRLLAVLFLVSTSNYLDRNVISVLLERLGRRPRRDPTKVCNSPEILTNRPGTSNSSASVKRALDIMGRSRLCYWGFLLRMVDRLLPRGLCGILVLGTSAACMLVETEWVWADQAGGPKIETSQWLTGGHDDAESYYSPLEDINTSNVARLGFAWSYDLATNKGLEGTPVVVDGVMYASAPWGIAHAMDARSGKALWTFDPKVDLSVTRKVCCGIVSRGLAVSGGRVFVAALDGRLFALDAKSGRALWKVDSIVDHGRGYTVTGSPYVAGNIVVIGNSGAEFDARGYVSGYNVKNGKLAWRFFTVPANSHGPFENPELKTAARTWSPDSRWDVGLGGTVWDGMAYDPKIDLLYVGVGNAVAYPRKVRTPGGGDSDANLFVSSILAIHAKTGRLAWYYQTVPGDEWDYDADANIVLADLAIGGRQRHVLMQAPKNGFFYVLDRVSGAFQTAAPYVPVNWASHIDSTGRAIKSGQADYGNGPKLVFPSPAGAHNWQPMAFNPGTGLVYIPAIEASAVMWMPQQPFVYAKSGINMGALYAFPAANAGAEGLDSDAAKGLPPLSELARGQPDTTIRSFLRAWDPAKQRVAWQVDTSDRWVGQLNAMWNGGGVISTAGQLVFQGRSTGYLYAYDARDGQQLAAVNVGTSIMAAPMTYKVDGIQYVSVMAGFGGALGGTQPEGTAAYRYGNAGRIVTFKLDGGPVPLPAEVEHAAIFPKPAADPMGTPEQIGRGVVLFKQHCAHCHLNQASGAVPDLRRMTSETFQQFDQIVLQGARAAKGMGNFSSLLSAADTYDIRSAIIDEAWRAYRAGSTEPQAGSHTPEKVPPTTPEGGKK